MADGKMTLKDVERAMRTLSTRVLLGPGEHKKKIYPINFTETEDVTAPQDDEVSIQSTYQVMVEDEDALTTEVAEQLAQSGDDDALLVQQFERDLGNMLQDIPDLQSALVSYQEARARISDRRKSRGFWPSKGCSKGRSKDHHGGFRGGNFVEHSAIGRPNVPSRDNARESANVVQHDGDDLHDLPQVIVEEVNEAGTVQHGI